MPQKNNSNFGLIRNLMASGLIAIFFDSAMSANIHKSGEFIRVDCEVAECISSMNDFDETERKLFGQIFNAVKSGTTDEQIIKTYAHISGSTTKPAQAVLQPPNTLINKASYYLVSDEANRNLAELNTASHLEVYFVNGTAYSFKVFTHKGFHVVTVFLENPRLKSINIG
jgi:hypothetical protein